MKKRGNYNLSVTNKTRERTPLSLSLAKQLKRAALGKDYNLSLVFVGDFLSRRLNTSYRGKKEPASILSFALSKKEGEVFLNPKKAKRQAKKFGMGFKEFLHFLLIHALCHLKGMTHGSKMEGEEVKLRKRFGV